MTDVTMWKLYGSGQIRLTVITFLTNAMNFELSPCCECYILACGWFPGVWILCAPHFGILCLFHLRRSLFFLFTRRVKIEQCSETSALAIQTPGNHPKDRILQTLWMLMLQLFMILGFVLCNLIARDPSIFWVSHCEHSILLGCDAAWLDKWFPTFRTSMPRSPSRVYGHVPAYRNPRLDRWTSELVSGVSVSIYEYSQTTENWRCFIFCFRYVI
jgi:hypothetical protein